MGLKLSAFTIVILLISNLAVSSKELDFDDLITFPIPVAPLTPLQRQTGTSSSGNIQYGDFTGRLQVPKSETDIPAIVMFHTCHGIDHYRDWITRFHRWGFATLAISRCQPFSDLPDDHEVPSLDWKRGALIALGALEHLSKMDGIDPERILVAGWSRLGMIPLSVLNFEGFSQFFNRKFRAGFALYPFCSFARGPHSGPLLIISAREDSYIDNKVCKRISNTSVDDAFPVTHVSIPGAVHGFDIPEFGTPHLAERSEINPDEFAAGGGIMGYNKLAHQEAIDHVKQFLERHQK